VTKRERARVVELLRCAADHVLRGERPETAIAITSESMFDSTLFGAGGAAVSQAYKVEKQVCREWLYGDWVTFDPNRYERLLEAAARVEEGDWP
jgi:hypothetical protein